MSMLVSSVLGVIRPSLPQPRHAQSQQRILHTSKSRSPFNARAVPGSGRSRGLRASHIKIISKFRSSTSRHAVRPAQRLPKALADTDTEVGAEGISPPPEGFDWLAHWYPVMWADDLEEGKPAQVTLFDEDYCLLRRPARLGGDTMCLKDSCPHRLVALSEGRMTADGLLQCAYHGWSFEKDGTCADVPTSAENHNPSSRTCAQSLPCEVVGGQVWVFPGALDSREPQSPPPVIPEMMPGSGWRYLPFVRDLPIDYSLLIENITDPDHGLFAHQSAPFDWYTGSVKYPQNVEVLSQPEEGGFVVESRVASANKLTMRAKTAKEELPKACVESRPDGTTAPMVATSRFSAPSTITLARRNADGAATFQALFWVVPTGLGRARFMSCALSRSIPAFVPRWVTAIGVNNFLDQDTHLLATGQGPYLEWELKKIQDGEKLNRRSFFCYQSPSENLLIAIGRFMDANLPSMPGRYSGKALHRALEAGLGAPPVRREVLDRWAQHTAVCPNSMRAVEKAKAAFKVAAMACACSLLAIALNVGKAIGAAGSIKSVFSSALSSNKALLAVGLIAGLAMIAASRFVAEFSFKYTEQLRDRDLKAIPKVYPDASNRVQ